MAGLRQQISVKTMAVSALEAQLKNVAKQPASNVSITLEQNHELVAARELIARRSFSWSQLLNDIERNLPGSVRVLRVAVTQIQTQERDGTVGGNEVAASLTLDVVGKSGTDVTQMINRLHDTGRFKVFPQSRKPIEGTEEAEFSLKVDYFPPDSERRNEPQVARGQDGQTQSNKKGAGQIAESK